MRKQHASLRMRMLCFQKSIVIDTEMELETFKRTVIPLRNKLLTYTLKLAREQVDAEDIVQDVFLKLWSMRSKLDDYRSVEALALTMTKNKVLDELKRHHADSFEDVSPTVLNSYGTVQNPESIAEQNDMVEYIKNFIALLPSLQQTIIRMKDVEGYELSEIVEITGAQVEAVRVNLSRARKKVREQLMQLHNTRKL